MKLNFELNVWCTDGSLASALTEGIASHHDTFHRKLPPTLFGYRGPSNISSEEVWIYAAENDLTSIWNIHIPKKNR